MSPEKGNNKRGYKSTFSFRDSYNLLCTFRMKRWTSQFQNCQQWNDFVKSLFVIILVYFSFPGIPSVVLADMISVFFSDYLAVFVSSGFYCRFILHPKYNPRLHWRGNLIFDDSFDFCFLSLWYDIKILNGKSCLLWLVIRKRVCLCVCLSHYIYIYIFLSLSLCCLSSFLHQFRNKLLA